MPRNNIVVLGCRITEQTGRKLAEELDVTYASEYGGERLAGLIRWGNGSQIRYNPTVTINSKDAVNRAVDKKGALALFRQRGIRVPEETTTPVAVGRTSEHTQGNGFWLCWEEAQMESARREGATHFLKYIPVKQEWRVHVIGGEVAFVQNKYETDRTSTAFMGVQGFRDAWHKRVLPPERAGMNVCIQAVNAVNALGLDTGGVDVLVSLENNRPYIIEVNSGAALPTEETRAPYLTYFRERLGI
jgi:glutathione synthase/RimK-type ligase-like ATP-grasp enzyme